MVVSGRDDTNPSLSASTATTATSAPTPTPTSVPDRTVDIPMEKDTVMEEEWPYGGAI